MPREKYDAVAVGAGSNGLSAAIRLAQAGLKALILEGAPEIGGGARSVGLTLPGFTHDVCAAVYPLAVGSPFLMQLNLQAFGLEWIEPVVPMAHTLADGDTAVLRHGCIETAAGLPGDEQVYTALFEPLVRDWPGLLPNLLRPFVHWPGAPVKLARFGWKGLRSARALAEGMFQNEPARALFGGLAAQPSLFDDSRAPAGRQTTWAYCHVPAGSTADMTGAIERRLEEVAPGFRDCILARHALNCARLERHNPNPVRGDINGGVADWLPESQGPGYGFLPMASTRGRNDFTIHQAPKMPTMEPATMSDKWWEYVAMRAQQTIMA